MKHFRPVLVVAVLICGLIRVHLPLAAHAAATAIQEDVALPVKNVPVGLMAWWIDPSHNEIPSAFRSTSLQSDAAVNTVVRGDGGGAGRGNASVGNQVQTPAAGILPVPKGVDSVRPDIGTNALLVKGTAEGVAALRKMVEFMDRPLQQVDIYLSFVETNFPDVSLPHAVNGVVNVSIARSDKGAILARLKADPQTQVQTFRVRTFSNVTARQNSETTELQIIGNAATPNAKLPVQRVTRLGFTATPTINHDGTITVALAPELSSHLVGENLGEAEKAAVKQRIDTVANVKDGETLIIGGLKPTSAGADGNKASRGLVILVTPRILRSDKLP
ncbi:MAG TPA: hypothetical protein VF600_06660 [Abditibacteriaceae bacterium]|jgi:hypothetical protein